MNMLICNLFQLLTERIMLEMTKDKHVEPESHFKIENSGKYVCYSVTEALWENSALK